MHGRDEYLTVTESPGSETTGDAVQAAAHRYAFVGARAAGRDVLDAACGAGAGLSLIARSARSVVAVDLAWSNVVAAERVARVRGVRASAERLPFADASFDVVALLQAIYYLARPEAFMREARRVLRTGGELVIVSVNPRWRDFQPSPLSRRYPDSEELRALFAAAGLRADLFGGFPADEDPTSRVVSLLRRASFRLRLPWPRALKRAIRSRVRGAPVRFPTDLASIADVPVTLAPLLPGASDARHRVLYALARKD